MSSHGQTHVARSTLIPAGSSDVDHRSPTARQIDLVRAVAAIALAIGFFVMIGDDVPLAASVLPGAAAAIITTYPLIDAVSSIVGARSSGGARRALHANAAISVTASIAIGVAAFGSDAGATLLTFGVWAAVSGALQFALALRRRRVEGGQLLMLVSGGLSTLAGLSFVAASNQTDVNLGAVSFYMILGAVLFIASARRSTV